MDLSLRQLTVFTAVARRLSFTAAAQDLLVSQSSLSRTIADIERTLGTHVLHRDTRNVTLTDEGRELLEVAEHIIAAHRSGMRRLDRFVEGGGGTVAVAALPSVAAVLLPPVITELRERWPGTEVRIHDGLARSVVRAVENGEADVAVTVATELAAGVSSRPLVRDLVVGVVPRDHPLAERDEIRWADLGAQPFIAMGADSSVRALTDVAFGQAGGVRRGVIEASSFATVGGLVAAGLGVSALPAMVGALLDFAPVEHRHLVQPVMRRRLDLIWPNDRPMSAAARRFLTVLDELRSGGFALPPHVMWA